MKKSSTVSDYRNFSYEGFTINILHTLSSAIAPTPPADQHAASTPAMYVNIRIMQRYGLTFRSCRAPIESGKSMIMSNISFVLHRY